MYSRGRNTNEKEERFIESHYEDFYQRYLKLRNRGEYSREDILKEFQAMVTDKEMEEMNNFYSQAKEEIFQYDTYNQIKSNIEEKKIGISEIEKPAQQQDKMELWTNRFKGWYGAIDRVPEITRARFIKMRLDIVKAIKSIIKDRNNPTQESTKEKNPEER